MWILSQQTMELQNIRFVELYYRVIWYVHDYNNYNFLINLLFHVVLQQILHDM